MKFTGQKLVKNWSNIEYLTGQKPWSNIPPLKGGGYYLTSGLLTSVNFAIFDQLGNECLSIGHNKESLSRQHLARHLDTPTNRYETEKSKNTSKTGP